MINFTEYRGKVVFVGWKLLTVLIRHKQTFIKINKFGLSIETVVYLYKLWFIYTNCGLSIETVVSSDNTFKDGHVGFKSPKNPSRPRTLPLFHPCFRSDQIRSDKTFKIAFPGLSSTVFSTTQILIQVQNHFFYLLPNNKET